MKSLICLSAFFILQMSNAMALDITCEGPNLHYVNQFDMQTSIDINVEELTEEVVKLEGVDLLMTVRNSGYNSQSETVQLEDLNLSVKKVNRPDVFGKEFVHLTFKSRKDIKPKVYGNVLIGYPGILSSFIRIGGLRQYKSSCK
ncbi:MAG: hypothetical protein KC493_07175 [Bacteriovoracaceae bacterium]|nr:hypothetical protein [Bacteriovoracaceae bacterium]